MQEFGVRQTGLGLRDCLCRASLGLHLIHLDLSIIICKTGILLPIFQAVVKIKMMHTKVSGLE